MNRLYPALAAIIICAAQPAAATLPEPVLCSEYPMELVVLVEASGSTEKEALANLVPKVPVVADSVGTPCVQAGMPAVEPYTDGTWRAVVELRVSGQEDDLRDVAASLGGAAKPVRLDGGSVVRVFIDGIPIMCAAGMVAAVSVVAYARFRKAPVDGLAVMLAGGLVFAATVALYITWVEVSRASVGA